jgi:hypothetical protein
MCGSRQWHNKEDAMNRSIHESEVAHRSRAESVEKVARDPFDDSVVSDDDIPWDEILADARSGVQGVAFEPEDILKWAEEDDDEE